MFYGIFALILFSVVLIITEYQNRYCWFFLLMTAGMILSFLSFSFHLSKFGNYSHGFNILFSLDFRVFSWVNTNIRLPMSIITRLMNVGIALYLLTITFFVFDLTGRTAYGLKRITALIILVIYYFWFYDPTHAYRIFIYSNQAAHPGLYTGIIYVLHNINRAWIFVFLFYPIFILYRDWKRNNTRYIKRQIFLLASCLGVLNMLFYSVFFMSPFMISPAKAITRGFWIFENVQLVYERFYLIIPFTIVGLLLLFLLLLLNFRLGSLVHIFADKKIHRDLYRMNEILSNILHSEKNLLFSILILSRQTIQEKDNPEQMLKTAEKIRDLAHNSLEKISETLEIIKDQKYRFRKNSLFVLLDEAIAKANLDKNIVLLWDKSKLDPRLEQCSFDYYHMNQALINLLNNAADAINASGKQDGIIQIDVVIQFQWIFIIIQDNGSGIKKDALKKIFDPHYSDKSGSYNWGLGLSYVYKVVKSHLGQIRVESRPGEGTSIQIILPLKAAKGV